MFPFEHNYVSGVCTRCGDVLGKAPALTVQNVAAETGDTITVDVTVNNNPGISAGAFRINFDSSVLQLVGAKPGDFPGIFFRKILCL